MAANPVTRAGRIPAAFSAYHALRKSAALRQAFFTNVEPIAQADPGIASGKNLKRVEFSEK